MARPRIYTEEEARQRKNARQREYEKRTGYASNIKAQKRNIRRYVLAVTKSNDSDIIERLDSIGNVNGYLKELIRSDIAGNVQRKKSIEGY